MKSNKDVLVLADPNSKAYQDALERMPEKWKRVYTGQKPWEEFHATAEAEITRFIASLEGDLTWKQLFRLFRQKIARTLKGKDR